MESMPKKSKYKKPKPKEVSVLSADEMETYIRLKYEVDDEGFWTWFFSECPWGETNILLINSNEQHFPNECKNYYNIIVSDFGPDADEEGCLEIENDL